MKHLKRIGIGLVLITVLSLFLVLVDLAAREFLTKSGKIVGFFLIITAAAWYAGNPKGDE